MSVKILVLSDSHGKKLIVQRICDMHKDADYIIHAGDGVSDTSFIKGMKAKIVRVSGNCDFSAIGIEDEERITVDGLKIFVCHGDMQGVKSSLVGLQRVAKVSHTDIVVFGHTHTPTEEHILREDGTYLHLFNPGAVKLGSFGLIQIKDGAVLFSHGTVRTSIQE